MKKTTKGAFAAGTAAVLLMGGAGTLAYWTDSASIAGDEISTGHLKLIDLGCDTGWQLDAGTALVAPYTGQLLVPGDSLTRACTYEIDAVGEHIEAELAVDKGTGLTSASAQLLEELDTSGSTITVGGAPYTSGAVAVTDGQQVVVSYDISWPFNDGVDDDADGNVDNGSNVSGGLSAALDAVSVTLTQTDPH